MRQGLTEVVALSQAGAPAWWGRGSLSGGGCVPSPSSGRSRPRSPPPLSCRPLATGGLFSHGGSDRAHLARFVEGWACGAVPPTLTRRPQPLFVGPLSFS